MKLEVHQIHFYELMFTLHQFGITKDAENVQK